MAILPCCLPPYQNPIPGGRANFQDLFPKKFPSLVRHSRPIETTGNPLAGTQYIVNKNLDATLGLVDANSTKLTGLGSRLDRIDAVITEIRRTAALERSVGERFAGLNLRLVERGNLHTALMGQVGALTETVTEETRFLREENRIRIQEKATFERQIRELQAVNARAVAELEQVKGENRRLSGKVEEDEVQLRSNRDQIARLDPLVRELLQRVENMQARDNFSTAEGSEDEEIDVPEPGNLH